MSPFLRFVKGASKIINSAELFSIWIIILLFEDWIDSMVAIWVCFVVCVRKINSRMPRRDRTKVIFWSFIWLSGGEGLNI